MRPQEKCRECKSSPKKNKKKKISKTFSISRERKVNLFMNYFDTITATWITLQKRCNKLSTKIGGLSRSSDFFLLLSLPLALPYILSRDICERLCGRQFKVEEEKSSWESSCAVWVSVNTLMAWRGGLLCTPLASLSSGVVFQCWKLFKSLKLAWNVSERRRRSKKNRSLIDSGAEWPASRWSFEFWACNIFFFFFSFHVSSSRWFSRLLDFS